MSNRIRKEKYDNIKNLNESLNSNSLLNEACINAGNDCTAAISCGGESSYHGTVSFSCTCDTGMGSFSSGWIDCGQSDSTLGGGTMDIKDFEIGIEGGYPCDPEDCPTDAPDCCEDEDEYMTVKGKTRLKEDCGCSGGGKETSEGSYMASAQLHSISNKAEEMYNKLGEDEVLDDWVESHLAKIDQMMDSVSDSFNHDQYKHAGDMGPGGCPPGHHWCAASDSCRSDNTPQTEPLTLMGADVVSLNEQASNAYNFDYCPLPADGVMTSSWYWDGTTCVVNGGTNNPNQNANGTYSTNGYRKLITIGANCLPSGGNCTYATPVVGKTWCVSDHPNNSATGVNPGGPCNIGSLAVITGNVSPANTSNGSKRFANDTPLTGYTPPPVACDTTTASPCAVQWWQNPNATWASNWITNRDCSNYTWPATNLEAQADAIMATAPTPAPNVFNDYNDIWNAGNSSGLTGQQKNQFIGKMAKGKFSECQKQACSC